MLFRSAEIAAGPVKLGDKPGVDLRDARHPLLKHKGGRTPVGNTVELAGAQNILIISGPNAGGKTVVLKTVGLLHLMAKAGLLLPAEPDSVVYLYDHVYLEMGDAQNLSANLSTFSGHLTGLKPILEKAGPNDLALLDELAVGTDPETGAAIGTAVLEDLAELFRAALGAMDEATTLKDEVALSHRYLDIEQLRFGSRLRLTWDLDPQADDARLPPLVLQPLIENAVRHGVEPSDRGGQIEIRTRRRRDRVLISVTNTVPLDGSAQRPGHGIGLASVRERLRLMHDLDCDFRSGLIEDGRWRVSLGVPV